MICLKLHAEDIHQKRKAIQLGTCQIQSSWNIFNEFCAVNKEGQGQLSNITACTNENEWVKHLKHSHNKILAKAKSLLSDTTKFGEELNMLKSNFRQYKNQWELKKKLQQMDFFKG